MKKILLISLLALVHLFASAQDDISAKLEKIVQGKYPKASDIESYEEDQGYSVEFSDGDFSKVAYFSDKGAWTHTQYEISEDELPAPVSKTIQSKYPSTEILTAMHVEKSNGYSYSVMVAGEEDSNYQLSITKDGQITESLEVTEESSDEDWEE